MGTTVKPYGNFFFDNLPGIGVGAGIRTMFGTLIPPGARVTFVRSTGFQDGDPAELNGRILPTLAAGLAECRSGLGDFVICLPGHSESVADATMLANLVAGTRVIGGGSGSMQATFRWTATASQWAINKADCVFSGLRLLLEGAAVVKAINVTGANTVIDSCDINTGSAVTTNVAVIAIEVGTGANNCSIVNNRFRSTAASAGTDCVLIVGTAVDGVSVCGNVMMASATAGNGLIRCTAAATNLDISDNRIFNSLAASSAGINFSNVAATGVCSDNRITILNTGAVTSGTVGIVVGGTNNLIGFFNNLIVNDPNTSGVLKPTVDT